MKDNEKELYTNSGDCVKYSGSLEVSVIDSGRVLSKKTYHNTGCVNLFHSIAAAIGGNYSESGSLRPYKLIAFKQGTNETLYVTDQVTGKVTKQFNPTEWNTENKVSTAVVYNGAPTITPLEDGIGYKTTFNFRLPFLTLVSGANTKIAKLGLYPKTQKGGFADSLCAYYILDEDQQISIPDNGKGGNFTIIITWVLKVTNAA